MAPVTGGVGPPSVVRRPAPARLPTVPPVAPTHVPTTTASVKTIKATTLVTGTLDASKAALPLVVPARRVPVRLATSHVALRLLQVDEAVVRPVLPVPTDGRPAAMNEVAAMVGGARRRPVLVLPACGPLEDEVRPGTETASPGLRVTVPTDATVVTNVAMATIPMAAPVLATKAFRPTPPATLTVLAFRQAVARLPASRLEEVVPKAVPAVATRLGTAMVVPSPLPGARPTPAARRQTATATRASTCPVHVPVVPATGPVVEVEGDVAPAVVADILASRRPADATDAGVRRPGLAWVVAGQGTDVATAPDILLELVTDGQD